MTAPNGATVEACAEAAERLLAAGFKPVKAKEAPEEQPRARKTTRKRD